MDFESFLRERDINISLARLPSQIKGFAFYDGVGYLVIINDRCSYYQQRETLIHELIHILECHFDYPKGYDDVCEKEVKNIIHDLKMYY